MSETAEQRTDRVRKAYGEIARTREVGGTCCKNDDDGVAQSMGDYSPAEIASVPQGAFLGEGSGNPVRAARLEPGEVVIDLGSGAGMDAFLAANAVGTTGRVIGFDMTPEMLARARGLLAGGGYPQVEFREANIARLPLEDASVDVVLSNCVINLTQDKSAVYREIFRVLKPGGRFAIADIVLRGDADIVHRNADRLPGCSCLSSADEQGDYLRTMREAGFERIDVAVERPAASQTDLHRFAAALGIDAEHSPVTAHALTFVGFKPSK